jgi:glutamate 5-kinase
MTTKLECARTSQSAGIECIIADGKKKDVLLKIMAGERTGTIFPCQGKKLIAKKRWIGYSSKAKGKVRVDAGASEALRKMNRSLLASGILGVEGSFRAGDVIGITDAAGTEIAKGVANYSSADIGRIKGLKTGQFKGVLGYEGPDEIIHKDNLVIL